MKLYPPTHQQRPIVLTEDEARALEQKLNVTSKGRIWSHIGDILYDYSPQTNLQLTGKQYEFLSILMSKKSEDECYGL